MNKEQAKALIKEVFEKPFNENRYVYFIKNLVNQYEPSEFFKTGAYIKQAFRERISVFKRLGKYYSPDDKRIDLLIVYLKDEKALNARTFLRNFIAEYLKGKHGTDSLKDATLVAFVPLDKEDWRFSLVKVDLFFDENGKIVEEKSPARRWSFLVGKNENSHTAQSQLVKILEDDRHDPTLKELEDAFSVEPVTKEFFERYRELFIRTVDELDKILKKDSRVREEFTNKGINTVDFAKKLLGQIVFLYFLQKKGWLGVPENKNWGEGDKKFLRTLFEKSQNEGKNFFNDYLEYLFYDALNNDRRSTADPSYHPKFDCKIPFLNGGLFEPIGNYDWRNIDINLPNDLFSNQRKTKEGDKGDGILDVFDRFNFTVKEDEPLEKEVAVDPELLGKLYEKFNAITPENFYEYKKALASGRKNEEKKFNKKYGVFYTPREIVHYMCQQSLIHYLAEELKDRVPKEDIEKLILHGEKFLENEETVSNKGRETRDYSYKLPESVRIHAKEIDEKLRDVKVVDPAVGSGAFLVGMMTEIVKARTVLSTYIKEEKRTPYDFKLQCIENSLYGVDIDQGATEIAKLRLWLSLVVDEESLGKIHPLPNLDYKIVRGNSLLSIERNVFNSNMIDEVERLKSLLFKETNHEKKLEYKKEIENLLEKITNGRKEFDFELYFSEVFRQKGGFDIVIANPPYIDSETMVKNRNEYRSLYKRIYESAKGNWDIFVIFIEKGLKICSKGNGILAYIVPNKVISAKYAEHLRDFLLSKTVMEIRDYSSVKVFKEVDVYPVVIILKNSTPEIGSVKMITMKNITDVESYNIISTDIFYSDTNWDKYFASPEILNLVLKISSFPPLKSIPLEISSSSTVKEAYEIKKYLVECIECTGRRFKKFINTGTIDKYLSLWGVKKTNYIKSGYQKPIIFDRDLINVSHKRYLQAMSPKLIVAGMTKEIECFYDEHGEYLAGKSTVVIIPQNNINSSILKAYLAILNSSLISFWFKYNFNSLSMAGGYLRVSHEEISKIPIPDISYNRHLLINLVDEILNILKDVELTPENIHEIKNEISKYERQINQIVYELYGLTEDEIKIVEESLGNKKKN